MDAVRLSGVRIMDPTTAFVNVFCTQLALRYHLLRQMTAWYQYEDHRPGSVMERFDADAAEYVAYTNLFRV